MSYHIFSLWSILLFGSALKTPFIEQEISLILKKNNPSFKKILKI